MNKFLMLDKDTQVSEVLQQYPHKSVILWKPVQSGKTADVLSLVESSYKESLPIFISDKNVALSSQTNTRARAKGFTIHEFRDGENIAKLIKEGHSKKVVLHFLMEINNMEKLAFAISLLYEKYPVTLIIDEGDKSRSTKDASDKEDEESKSLTGEDLPPITKLILQIKNMICMNDKSRAVFVSATPQGILCSEKDEWLVLYKAPYNNYVGVRYENNEHNVRVEGVLSEPDAKTSERWVIGWNNWMPTINRTLEAFKNTNSKDESVKQICLISLESRNINQGLMGNWIHDRLKALNFNDVDLVIFNSKTKKSADETLADRIASCKNNKIIIIAGFMAARGVSFTDFSDSDNKFELVIQLNYTKPDRPVNSALQAMRVFGPARRTVSRPMLVTNETGKLDMDVTFHESYRVIRDIAEGINPVMKGSYPHWRPLSQKENFRYLKQGNLDVLLFESFNKTDHLPILYDAD